MRPQKWGRRFRLPTGSLTAQGAVGKSFSLRSVSDVTITVMLKHALMIALLAVAAMSAGCGRLGPKENLSSAAIDANKYYAVLLSNGSVYFGKLEGLETPYPVLQEISYLQ